MAGLSEDGEFAFSKQTDSGSLAASPTTYTLAPASSAGVDQSLLASLCFCLPSFPASRSRESDDQSRSLADDTQAADLPSYAGPELSEKTFDTQHLTGASPFAEAAPRGAPPGFSAARSVPRSVPVALRSYFDSPPGLEPPPYYPVDGQPKKGNFTPDARPKPLRLVRLSKKKKSPVVYESSTHRLIQSLTTLTFDHPSSPPLSPPPAYTEDSSDAYSVSSYYHTSSTALQASSSPQARKRRRSNSSEMASNPTMPKVSSPPPPPVAAPSGGPRPPFSSAGFGGGAGSKEDILADLRRQLDDSASDAASSVDSRGRRRPRNRSRNNKQLAAKGAAQGLQGPGIMPRLAETKPVRLQLGLNLDVELELKARLQGDVSLTLLVESKQPKPRDSVELKLPGAGAAVNVQEMFFMRIGVLRLRRTWVDVAGREVQDGRTGFVSAVLVTVMGVGVAVGWAAARWFS